MNRGREPTQKRAGGLIANHLEAVGPIAAYCSIPLRLYAWTVADMVDENKAAAWLQWISSSERWNSNRRSAHGWQRAVKNHGAIPALAGCIPVFQDDYDKLADTLHLSMEVLRQGKCLLVFPEDNRLVRTL